VEITGLSAIRDNMTDYNALKVPELKKELTARNLAVTGNKPDLIKRLQDDDEAKGAGAGAAQNGEFCAAAPGCACRRMDYTDSHNLATDTAEEEVEAPKAAAPTTASATAKAPESTAATPATKPITGTAAPAKATADTDATPAAPAFSQHLPPSSAKTEAEKRAARAKRFNIEPAAADSEEAKKAERAGRFGLDNNQLTGLDSALPERPLKRGRERGDVGGRGGGAAGANKRAASGEPSAVGGGNVTGNGATGAGRGRGQKGGRGGREAGGAAAAPAKKSILDDPAEKAKAEARAKRFAVPSKDGD
jgi:SAP domain-containing ribonucleoprotein